MDLGVSGFGFTLLPIPVPEKTYHFWVPCYGFYIQFLRHGPLDHS